MKTYQALALNTLSDQYHIGAINPDLMHASIGLTTESGELLNALHVVARKGGTLDTINLIEELGDVMWYVAVACHALATDIGAIRLELTPTYLRAMAGAEPTLQDVAIALSTEAAGVGDILKRTVFYGAALNTTGLIELLKSIITLVEVGCLHLDTNIEAACAINIAKLQRRFPNRFTSAQAIERDLVSERAVLEGGPAPS